MNTNNLKSFAREARKMFLSGVANRLNYWGFDLKTGACTESLEVLPGGYFFRNEPGDGDRVPRLWQKLRERVRDAQAVRDVVEEASYSWFNRLMAIQILEKNGFIAPTLAFADGSSIPLILQNARLGQHDVKSRTEQVQLQQFLEDDRDEQAFALLLRSFCNQNPLIRNVFGRIDDFTEILLPDNLLSKNGILQHINNSNAVSDEDFRQVELIGWLYQFYIADKKDEVFAGFKKNQKARAEDIPAATQIFTPRWIVRYMVENTVGRIWLDNNPDSTLKVGMKYLVDSPQETDDSTQLITRNAQLITNLKLLDPACGSGHILVEGFDLLFRIYDEEGYNKREAALSILRHNLFGLDIDERAAQLAQFAVLLKAAQCADKSLLNAEVMPHIHAMPAPYDFSDDQIQTFLDEKGAPPDGLGTGQYFDVLQAALTTLQQGRNIGSALIISLTEATRTYIHLRFKDLTSGRPLSFMEESVLPRIKPFIEVLLILSDRFEAIAANPPYMTQRNMNTELKDYANFIYPTSCSDLFTIFVDVAIRLSKENALLGMINQHSWMFLPTFESFRKKMLREVKIENMLHLGSRVFEELSGEVVQSTAFVVKKTTKVKESIFFNLLDFRSAQAKETAFVDKKCSIYNKKSDFFLNFPAERVSYWLTEHEISLFSKDEKYEKHCPPKAGLQTGDNDRFLKYWHEIEYHKIEFDNLQMSCSISKKFFPYNKGGGFRRWYGNNFYVINWQKDGQEIRKHSGSYLRSYNQYFREGLTWSAISGNDFALRYSKNGFIFDTKGPMCFPNKGYQFPLALGNSKLINRYLDAISPTLDFNPGALALVPYLKGENLDRITEIETLADNALSISRTDWNAHETSWDFEKSPLLQSDSLRRAYAAWEQAATTAFWQLHANEERLNELFIGIYGLEAELTPSVSPSDVTILQSELKIKNLELKNGDVLPINRKEVMAQFLNYLLGCLMGRYRLDKTGLHIAHAEAKVEEYEPYTFSQITNHTFTNHTFTIDEDGIVPIMGKYSPFADDVVGQVKTLLQQLWGETAETDNLNFLNDCLEEPLEEWLTNPKKHWEWHKRQYHRKPIYWLFASSSGKDAAFKALVYQHRITRHTVGTLLNKYVLKHLQYLREETERLKNLDKAGKASKEDLKQEQKNERDIVECEKYVEVLKGIGDFEIDLDDGVTVNYEKFGKAVVAL
jgi:Eco57I restriction-modification methylase